MSDLAKTAHEIWEEGLVALGAPLAHFVPGLRPIAPVDVAETQGEEPEQVEEPATAAAAPAPAWKPATPIVTGSDAE